MQICIKPGNMSMGGPTTAIEMYVTGTGTATEEARARISRQLEVQPALMDAKFMTKYYSWERGLDKITDSIDNLLVTKAM